MSNQATRKKIIEEMEREGRVTAERLVEAARPKSHPLHEDFEWDDKTAAYAHRLATARRILTSVQMMVTTETLRISVPSYVRDPSADPGEQGYISTARLMSERELAYEALQDEVNRIASLVERTRGLAAVFGLDGEFESMLRSITRIRAEPRPSREGEDRPIA